MIKTTIKVTTIKIIIQEKTRFFLGSKDFFIFSSSSQDAGCFEDMKTAMPLLKSCAISVAIPSEFSGKLHAQYKRLKEK
jgi:hypothetical protein